jgi:uncharacterized radical SAM protein YgiQ
MIPVSRRELDGLGWDQPDVIIIAGDALVDHPAFGPAVIARALIDAGFSTAVIPQPRWQDPGDIARLGRPRLFFGVTAGNVDSMVANYSPSLQRRRDDDYSPGGKPGLRPNRAVTVYSNLVRHAFPGVPIVLGGVEASLRRLAHYDYWDDAVRRSILVDTRADILCYGMAEAAAVEIARRLAAPEHSLDSIPGTALIAREPPAVPHVPIPSFEQVAQNKEVFNTAFRLWHRESENPVGKPVVQPHADRFVVQYPPARPLAPDELDRIYELPYTRRAHPSYREPVPALETVRFSIVSHRGCLGTCSFCSLGAHQGRIIQSRSRDSIVREAERVARLPGFKGHITDLGGPSANMYAAGCLQHKQGRVCPDRECTYPERCSSLRLGIERELELLAAVRSVPGVKRVTVGSGIRFDLLAGKPGEHYLVELCRHHVSGQLRIAPEHVAPGVLAAMHKPGPECYLDFRKRYAETNRQLGLKQYLIPYFIAGHPGATLDDAVTLAEHLVRVERIAIRQVQQFTPLPMTRAAAAWHTGKDPLDGTPLYVARDPREMRLQRALLQLHEPANYIFAVRELTRRGRRDLVARIHALKHMLAPRPLDTTARRPILKRGRPAGPGRRRNKE